MTTRMMTADVSPEVSDLARTRLQAARAHTIAAVTPYFGNALSAMVLHEVPGLGTVATDARWRFYYDPDVVVGWSLGMCSAAWLHELKHNLHRHTQRFEALGEPASRHSLFNIAADSLINEDLMELARITLRGGYDPSVFEMGSGWVYLSSLPVPATRSDSAEQIYRMLVAGAAGPCPLHGEEECTCPTSRDCGSGSGSRHPRWWELPQDDGTDGSVDEGRGQLIAHDAAHRVTEHVRRTGRASVPGGFLRWADETMDPVVDWHSELRSVVSNRCAAVVGRRDYSYARPSRRTVGRGLILPGMRDPRPPNGAVVLDTSGSMGHEDLTRGIAEIAGIVKQVSRGRSRLQFIACDAAASAAQPIRSMDALELVGGGGTDMGAGIAAAAALRPKVDFVAVFTDGLTDWPAAPPEQNPRARYIAVLTDGPRPGVPDWMRSIVVADAGR